MGMAHGNTCGKSSGSTGLFEAVSPFEYLPPSSILVNMVRFIVISAAFVLHASSCDVQQDGA